MAAGIAWRVLRQSPGCSSKRMRMPRMLRTSPKAGAIRRRMPSCSSMRRSRCSRSSVLRRASRRAARRCSSWRVRRRMRRSAPAPPCARVRRRRRWAGRAGGGAGSAHGTIIARPASRAATLRRPRERASALQRHLALLLQAAEDGVGDLHPLGIGIVAVGQITVPRSRLRDERHVGAEAVGGTGLVQQALALQRLWRGAAWRSCAVAAPSASSASLQARFREIGQS